jgi:hypothetical protein
LNPFNERTQDVMGANNIAYPPNEVLQHLPEAPKGDQFDDAYYSWPSELPRELRLPDSDLLKALHTYASDYYGHAENATRSLTSMDGTALIASAVLLEELVAESLSKSGDLVFCEAKGEDNGALPKFWNGAKWVDHHLPANAFHVACRRKESPTPTRSVSPVPLELKSIDFVVSRPESTPVPEELVQQLQERRHELLGFVADLKKTPEEMSNATKRLLAQPRPKILSAEDRQTVLSRIRDINAQIEARKLDMLGGV